MLFFSLPIQTRATNAVSKPTDSEVNPSDANAGNTKDTVDEISGPVTPGMFNIKVDPGTGAESTNAGASDKAGIFGIAFSTAGFGDTILLAAIKVLFLLVGALSIFYIMYSGIQLALAAGDETKIAQAKRSLIWSLVGIVLALSAYTLIVMTSNAASYTAKGKTSLSRTLEHYV